MLSIKAYFNILNIIFFKDAYSETHPFHEKQPNLIQVGIYNIILVLLILLPLHLYLVSLAWAETNTWNIIILVVVLVSLNIVFLIIDDILLKDEKEIFLIPYLIAGSILSSLVHGIFLATMGLIGLIYSALLGILIGFYIFLDTVNFKKEGLIMGILGAFVSSLFGGSLGLGFVFMPIFQIPLYPFLYFQKVYNPRYPLQWNENITLPLWFLAKKIRKDAKSDTKESIKFCLILSKMLFYKEIAQKALSHILIDVLLEVKYLHKFREKAEVLDLVNYWEYSFVKEFEEYFSRFREIIDKISHIWYNQMFLSIRLPEFEIERRKHAPQKALIELEEFKEELEDKNTIYAKEFIKIIEHWQVLIKNNINPSNSSFEGQT